MLRYDPQSRDGRISLLEYRGDGRYEAYLRSVNIIVSYMRLVNKVLMLSQGILDSSHNPKPPKVYFKVNPFSEAVVPKFHPHVHLRTSGSFVVLFLAR